MLFSYTLEVILIVTFLFFASEQQLSSEIAQIESKEFFCKCMDYWECYSIGGQLYSYCAFSNEVCCVTNDSISYGTTLMTENRKSAVCGKKQFDSGIAGFAEPGEWSWHTAILISNKELYMCGGTLIDERWVLTAAHCVDNIEPQTLKARIGEHDVSNTKEPEKHIEIGIEKIFIHSDSISKVNDRINQLNRAIMTRVISVVLIFPFDNQSLVNDIALLKLKDVAKKMPNINIVCLPNRDTFSADTLFISKCFITGWGKTYERGEYSSVLKEVNVPLWNHTDCERALRVHFGPNYRLSKTAICGGDVGHDACDGDGGGGLFCEQNQLWYQIGIISFGIGCGRKDKPGVYTDVMSYLDWIYTITSEE